MVEQNAKKALEIADRAYVLVAGQCVYEGSGKELGEEELGRLLIGARRL
jgi:ABC-type branched-subunit amino acid transport system ATPase component